MNLALASASRIGALDDNRAHCVRGIRACRMAAVHDHRCARDSAMTVRQTQEKRMRVSSIIRSGLHAATILAMLTAAAAMAEDVLTVQITVKNHIFEPAEIHAPAGVPIVLRVKNLDPTPMEFESASLRVEKVVTASSEGVINLRPLQPGQYKFFDDFHQQTSGVLIVP